MNDLQIIRFFVCSQENLFKHFEDELKGIGKIVQKRISQSGCKFTVHPLLDNQKVHQSDVKIDKNEEIDFSKLDPNQLLKDDIEELLKKK